MNTYLEFVISEYRNYGLLIDTNLLLVLCTGKYDTNMIGKNNRTESYTLEDYIILERIVKEFNILFTLPNILTELSNLVTLKGDKLKHFSSFLIDFINDFTEEYIESRQICKNDAFKRLGLSDTGIILTSIEKKCLVITADLDLASYLHKKNINVINFNHIRGPILLNN